MLVAYIITGVCLFFQAERGILDTLGLLRTFKRLSKSQPHKTAPHRNGQDLLYILIPVLREQNIVVGMVQNMCRVFDSRVQIVVITTQKEDDENVYKNDGALTTAEILEQELHGGTLSNVRTRVEVLHSQLSHGRMADQVNLAIERIHKRHTNAWFILYNADSIPSPTTQASFERIRSSNPGGAYQQPCAFTKDVCKNSSPFQNALAIFQTLFCLGHETSIIERYTRRLKHTNRCDLIGPFYPPSGYIVGHGSSMNASTCLGYGGYPTQYLAEDLLFGFILSAHQAPIYSVDSIEIADTPRTFWSFIQQRSVWFWNFLEYPRCAKNLFRTQLPRSRTALLCLIGCSRGTYWFCASLLYIVPILIGLLMLDWRFIFIGCIGIICFQVIPAYCVIQGLPDALDHQGLGDYAKNLRAMPMASTLSVLPLITVTEFIGPWIGMCRFLRWKITGTLPEKPKTD